MSDVMAERVRAIGNGLDEVARELTRLLDRQKFLSDVVAWIAASGGRRQLVDVIVQDEFTRDVLVRWTGEGYLAYDVT